MRPVGRYLEVYKNLNIDVLVAEIGSTTTVVNAFDNINSPAPAILGQGQAPTSVLSRVGGLSAPPAFTSEAVLYLFLCHQLFPLGLDPVSFGLWLSPEPWRLLCW